MSVTSLADAGKELKMRIIVEQLGDGKWAVKQMDLYPYIRTFITLATFDDEKEADEYAEKKRKT